MNLARKLVEASSRTRMYISAKIRSYTSLVSIAAIAFIAACVSHEVIGHGSVCLAVGGYITWLSSVYFHCSNGDPLVDAAGPTANLIVGALCWWLLQARPSSPSACLLLVLTMAFNLFWGAGYFIFSAVTNTGDWAWVLRDLALTPLWLWRSLLGVLGVFIYARSVRIVYKSWPTGVSFVVPYLTAGAISCLATFFYFGPMLPAFREAAEESFVAAIGLLWLAGRAQRSALPAAPSPFSPSNYWSLFAVVIVFTFWLTLGRGFGSP